MRIIKTALILLLSSTITASAKKYHWNNCEIIYPANESLDIPEVTKKGQIIFAKQNLIIQLHPEPNKLPRSPIILELQHTTRSKVGAHVEYYTGSEGILERYAVATMDDDSIAIRIFDTFSWETETIFCGS